MPNFLPLPSKRTNPLPTFPQKLLSYIGEHFKDSHPEAFRGDVDALVGLRKEWVEPKGEGHGEVVKGLMRYHAQLAFLSTKFPSDIGQQFPYHLPFPPPFSLTPDTPISLPSLTFERACVLWNIAALYGSMAASERREEGEGIKRALGYLGSAAGILNYLIVTVLPLLQNEMSTPNAAGQDMTESFLGCMREFVLAEAQECYWQQAVLQGTYKNGLIGKLSMKVSEYYKASLASANGTDYPSSAFIPANWISHIQVKQLHFEAAAQYRLSQEDLEKSRYGDEIARLRVAEGLCKKGLDVGKRGVGEAVVSDLKNLSGAVKTALDRAVRDNDLVYVSPIPAANQLSPIVGVGMVKLVTPSEIAEPVAWLMGGKAGMGPLFSGLVPYGVHVAISIYDDRKDNVVRDLDGRREELDGVAASTLQSLNLPGSIQALERPVGLPPSLLKKAEEVDSAGGISKIRGLLTEVNRLSRSNAKLLSDAMDILDQEATENETLISRQPHLANSRQPSHVANQQLIATAGQYDATIKQASGSDATVRAKWEEWASLIEILEGGEDTMTNHIPSSTSTTSLPTSVRPLRASLELLDDAIQSRHNLVKEAKQIAETDDIRPEVLKEAAKLAHGGSGDVRPEWFEAIFESGLEKFEDVRKEMEEEVGKQEELLERIRIQNETFLSERKDDPRIRERERKLQEMDLAYWKWREIVDNIEEGIKFYNSFAEMLHQFKTACLQFLNSRRVDVGSMTNQFQTISMLPSSPPSPSTSNHQNSYHAPSPSSPPRQPPPQSFSLPHPTSSQWQDSHLPPPPPAPILRSSGIQTQPRASIPHQDRNSLTVPDTPRRSTRSTTARDGTSGTPRGGGVIGDPDRNPYQKGKRSQGGGVI